ncbi:hypothetical protein PYCC9005_004663 [Savitreella phatthalungensis]
MVQTLTSARGHLPKRIPPSLRGLRTTPCARSRPVEPPISPESTVRGDGGRGRVRRAGLAIVKYGLVGGLAGYIGFSLSRQLVHPLPTPAVRDLPRAEVDAHVAEIEQLINTHPTVQALRTRQDLHESRPHLRIHPSDKPHNLTAGTLAGPGKITVAPYVWGDREGKELYVVAHLGRDLCGHDGIVHGGLLATFLDEGLARCCFRALPNKIGVTANLTIDYRKPTRAHQLVLMTAHTTSVQGRKAYVEGKLQTMPRNAWEQQVTLVEATALFVEPRYAKMMRRVVRQEYLE